MRDVQYDDGQENAANLFQLFQTDDPEFPPIANHRRALAGTPVSYEYEFGGRVFDTHLEPMRAPDGSIEGVIGVATDITERRSAEQMLRKSEERNRLLVENATDIIYTHDFEGNIKSVSPAAEAIAGYTHDEALRLNIATVIAPEQLEIVRETIRRKMAGLPAPNPYELDIFAKDGRRITLEVNTRLVYRNGAPVAIQGIARDITDRKQAERIIRQSESKFRAVAETAASAIFIFQDDRYLYVNPASEHITGYKAEELLQMRFFDLVHPDHREVVRQRGLGRQIGEAVPNRYEIKILTKNGDTRWLDFTASVIEYEDATAVLGTAFDVTERKQAEEELQVQKAYLEELFQSAPEGVVVLNNEGTILRANREFLRMFGYSFQEIQGAHIDDFIVPDDRKSETNSLTKAITQGRPYNIETQRRRKDGSLLEVSILGTPIVVANGQIGRYVIYRDITERKRAERYRETQFATTRTLAESKTVQEAVLQLMQIICGGVDWDYARMWHRDANTGGLRLEAAWQNPSFHTSKNIATPQSCPGGDCVGCMVAKRGEATWVTDITEDICGDPAIREAGLRSCFVVPIRHANEIAGVLEFFSRAMRYPDFELLKAMTDIGSQIGLFIDRKQAEHALIESEAKFRAVADTATSGIYIHSDDRFLYVNRACELISGYTRQELLQRKVWEVVHPEDLQRLQLRAASRKRGENVPSRYEFRLVHKNGDIRWVDFSAALIQFEGQSAILATVFDITDRKRGEQLQSALYRIANLASSATDLQQFYRSIHDIVGELMYARNFYIAVLSEDGDNIEIPYFVDEEDATPPSSDAWRGGLTDYLLRTGEPLLVDPKKFQQLVNSGEVISRGAPSIDWVGVPLKIGDKTFGVLAVQSYSEKVRFGKKEMDILSFVSQQVASTIEHRRSQEALRRSEMRYRSQVQSAVYGIYRSSLEGKFLDVNPALVQMLGYASPEELFAIDMATDLYVDPNERRRHIREYGHAERIDAVETRWKRKDGKVITVRLSGRGGLKYPGEPESFEMICEDITERRTLEEQLLHSQKMEAVGRLAGGVAHDFNNLLTVIKGYSDLIVNELPEKDPMRGEVDEIRRAAERAAQLTHQLLAFSRRQVMAPRVLDLNVVIGNIQKMLKRLLGEDVELHVSLAPNLGRVKADPGQLEQVIMNLAVNARDAMPKGGKLTIETSNRYIDDSYARELAVVNAGEYAMIAVSDTGQGMDPETASHIFEPFFTTKETGKGTGLGLSTVYGIVKQSGGYIWVYSEPGMGTTFKVYLPIVESADADETGVRASLAQSYRGTETILLVEDEDGVRALIREVLQRHGYTVIDTRNGGEALIECERHKGEIQLLLTDVVLAQVTGTELAKRLSSMRPAMKVLFVSGYTEEAIIHHGVLEPGTAFLQKPFTPTVLARKVREVLTGQELD